MKQFPLTIIVQDTEGSPLNILIHASLKAISETQLSANVRVYAPQLESLDSFVRYNTENVTFYAKNPPKNIDGFVVYMQAGFFPTDDILLRLRQPDSLHVQTLTDEWRGYGVFLRSPDKKMAACRTGSACDPLEDSELFCGPLFVMGDPWGPQVGYRYTARKLQYYFNTSGAGYGNIGHSTAQQSFQSVDIVPASSAEDVNLIGSRLLKDCEHIVVLIPGTKYEELISLPLFGHSRIEAVPAWGVWGDSGKGLYLGLDIAQAAFLTAVRYQAQTVLHPPFDAPENVHPLRLSKVMLKRALAKLGYVTPSKDIDEVSKDEFCLWTHIESMISLN